MAIKEGDVRAVTAGELLKKNLIIPEYQRPYSWKPETALQLLEDIIEAKVDVGRGDSPYVLGTVILHENGEFFDVVDGQQRLLTLKLIISILSDGEPIVGNKELAIAKAWKELKARLGSLPDKEDLKEFIENRCHLVKVVTDDLGEAFRIFDSQNYRGKPLLPHDLLKAYHLREMKGESEAMQVAIVDKWESSNDGMLDELFSTYLYRIKQWSRGQGATKGFTVHDINLFKGISTRKPLPPVSRYHFTASALDFSTLSFAGGPQVSDKRNSLRSRFQLDSPVIAGRQFFEMAAFMLDELEMLKSEAYDDNNRKWGFTKPGKDWWVESRYRYVAQLYVAALFYFTNKFGNERMEEAKSNLFSWSYAPRVKLLRVYIESIDKVARGDEGAESAFALLRIATSSRDIRHPSTALPGSARADKDASLLDYLNNPLGNEQ